MPGVRLSSWWASLTTAFPFSSSSPTLRRPTPGVGRPITSRAYTEPRWAKPTSSRASQSTLAPPSRTSTDFPAVGNGAPMAARCTPGCNRSIRVAAAITAPVLPAEMNASDSSRFCRPRPTAMDERGLLLIAASGFSPIPTTSDASATSSRARSTSPCAFRAASISAVRPTSWMRNVGASSRSASTAPSTSTRGASSPPIASSATRITSGVLDRHPLFVLVVAAGGAHTVRALPVAAAWARLEGRPLRLVVRAAQPLLALRCPSLGYRHGDPRLVAELPFQRRERGPARIHRGGGAAAGARVQVLAAPRAQPVAVRPALQVLRDGEQQLLPDRRREVDQRRLGWQGIGIRILQRVGVLREQHPDVRRHDAADGGEAAAALSADPGAERAVPIETSVTGCLQPPAERHGVGERDRHALKERVVPGELGLGFDGATRELPPIDL